MEIHVRVPVRITLTGEPGPDELAELTRRLTALVARRLAQAEREVGRGHRTPPWAAADGTGVREPHEPERDVADGYALPSYADAGRRTKLPVRGREPWTVVRTVRARIEVDRFLGYVAEVRRQPFPQAVLYRELTGTVRDVDVLLVRLDRPNVLETLGLELLARNAAAQKGGKSDQAWAISASETTLGRLAEADESGAVAARIPHVPLRHAVFAVMRLPHIDLTELAVLGPANWVGLTVREAGFCVDPGVFQRATGVPWSQYAEELANEPITVATQPAVLRAASNAVRTPAGIDRELLLALFDRRAFDGRPHLQPASRLFVAEGGALPGVPDSVRQVTEWPDETGERVLYCRALLDVGAETLGAVIFRPEARRLAGELVALIGDQRFGAALDGVLTETLSQARGRFGGLFAYVLDSVERRGSLAEFFDAADATRQFALRLRLLQQCETTRYARHDRVHALRAALAKERTATTAHAYTVGGTLRGSVRLDRREDGTVLAGQNLGEVDFLYQKTRTVTRAKPGRAEALSAALLAERERMIEDIFAGRDQRVYGDGEFAAAAVERAARAAHITAADFETVDIEFGIRLVAVHAAQEHGLPSYEVEFEIVSREKGVGAQWGVAVGPLREPVGAFEARLVEWRLGQAGEAYRIAGFAVFAIGGIALAWEAGVVASLVRLAGGIGQIGWGVGFAEAAYVLKLLRHEEDASVGGFLTAAVDGYVGAVGYRIGGGLGGWAGERIGTALLRSRIAGWILGKIGSGAVGGGAAAALVTFANDIVDARWSGIDVYVERMEFYAVVGVIAAFTVEPLLHALMTRAGPTLIKAALLTRLLNNEGVTAERWAEALALTRQRMENALGQSLPAAEAQAWARALGTRVDEAAEGLAHARPVGTASRVPARVTSAHETPAAGSAPAPGSVAEAAPVTEAAPVSRVASGTEAAPASQVGPVSQGAPVTEAAPVSQAAPVTEAAPVSRAAPGTETAPVSQTAPVTEAAPVSQASPVTEAAPVTKAAPGTETAPATEAASAATEAASAATEAASAATRAVRPRTPPATTWSSWARLWEASLTDREAAWDRRWYETASIDELRAREAHDPVAKEMLDAEWGGAKRPYQPERPTDPAVQARLREDLRAARAAVEAERLRLVEAGLRKRSERERAGWVKVKTRAGTYWLEPTDKAAAGYEGTIAVARSDIPALAGELFTGGSPRALGSYDPTHDIRPADSVVVPQAHGHAEQDIGQQIDARLARMTEAELAAARGHTVYIRVDQEVCTVCAAGLGGGSRGGVLAKLSARHPDIVFEITADDVSTVYRIIGGKRVK
ncbi:hypothetical protein [Streptomyces sp. NPDC094032]|uniref:hypothetical protein n=1 Tax=Streptomyces sp. NPDC094032 TaxID=3155308 RepID=UPI003330461A